MYKYELGIKTPVCKKQDVAITVKPDFVLA